jgi:single-strand DNA-binding protein
MARGLNTQQVIGYLGHDPSVRTTQSGAKVASFSVAVTDAWTGKDGTRQESTEWFRFNAWKGLADLSEQYLKKGNRVYVAGPRRTREYTGRDGAEKTSTEYEARELVLLGGREDGQGQPRPVGDEVVEDAGETAFAGAVPASFAPNANVAGGDDDADLPF